MFSIAKEVFGEYGITLTDQNGQTDPSQITATEIPNNGKPTDFAAITDLAPVHANEIAVVFSKTMAPMGDSGAHADGATEQKMHMTIIPEYVQNQRSMNRGGLPSAILAHEIGHNFGMRDVIPVRPGEVSANLVMYKNTAWRVGSQIRPEDEWRLRRSYLPDPPYWY